MSSRFLQSLPLLLCIVIFRFVYSELDPLSRLEQIVRQQATDKVNLTDPHVFKAQVKALLTVNSSEKLEPEVFEVIKKYLLLASACDDLDYTCSKETVDLYKSLQAHFNSQTNKLAEENLNHYLKLHLQGCYKVYENRYNEHLDVDKQQQAELFGRRLMFHLVSRICLDNRYVDKCMKAKAVGELNDLSNEVEVTRALYKMLLDLANEESQRESLLKTGHLKEKGKNLVASAFDACFGSTKSKECDQDPSAKLESNSVFNKLYKKYIVCPCELIITSAGRDVFAPLEYARVNYKRDLFYDATSYHKETPLPFLYSWLAYSACNSYVLDPERLNNFSLVINEEVSKGVPLFSSAWYQQ